MKPNRLQEIMFEKNITYGELARLTGISGGSLYKISNFYQSPTQNTMISIAKGLGLKVTDVFYLDY